MEESWGSGQDEEQARLGDDDRQVHHAAIGFALKEACSKAIGTGFASGVRKQDFLVTIGDNDCSVFLTGAAKRRATQLCPAAASPRLHARFRSCEAWVSALAVLAPDSAKLGDLWDHLSLPDALKSRYQPRR